LIAIKHPASTISCIFRSRTSSAILKTTEMRDGLDILGNDAQPPLEMYDELGRDKNNYAFCSDHKMPTLY